MITPKQQRLYRKYIDILSEHTGYLNREMHELVKWVMMVESVYNMEPERFSVFMEKLYCWAAQNLNCVLPEPK